MKLKVVGGASVFIVITAALLNTVQLNAQTPPQPAYKRLTGPQTYNPGEYPVHFPYPDQYNAVAASPEVHHLRYTDAKIDLVEVAYFPGVKGQMHGHPFPSVFALTAPAPKTLDVRLDPEPERMPLRAPNKAPDGMDYPNCMLMNPQPPHAPANLDTFPNHFYRLAFKRIDGTDIQVHWREWYPRMLDAPLFRKASSTAASKARFSEAWPFSGAYDSIIAAPNNFKLLFENEEMRLIEVTLRPGETSPMQGSPYPSVVMLDSISDAEPTVKLSDPKSPLNGQGARTSPPLPGFPGLRCMTTGPRAPHTLHNGGKAPIHYYKIEFKRINGQGIRENWRTWYPWLAKITDETATHPYIVNY